METEELFRKLDKDAKASGYNLNPDKEFTIALVEGLLTNEKRYGYQSCPCRLATGKKEEDLDIICPCDYRDPDLNQFGSCFCGLYVSEDILSGKKKLSSIPERRPAVREPKKPVESSTKLKYPVWRCSVCGYICARDEPPEICPICKVKKERFERFM